MTTQVIDFMAHLHAKRSMGTIKAPAPETASALAVATLPAVEKKGVMGLEEDRIFQGSKYDKNRQARDIPALIRADIKAAKAARKIHKDVKVSVRFESYSMGCAIRVNVTRVPAGLVVYTSKWVAHEKNPDLGLFDFRKDVMHTPEARALLDLVSSIVTAYQKTRENMNSDYSNVNFHADDVKFDLG